MCHKIAFINDFLFVICPMKPWLQPNKFNAINNFTFLWTHLPICAVLLCGGCMELTLVLDAVLLLFFSFLLKQYNNKWLFNTLISDCLWKSSPIVCVLVYLHCNAMKQSNGHIRHTNAHTHRRANPICAHNSV